MEKQPRPKKIAVCIPWAIPFMWTSTAFHLMNLDRPTGVDVKFIPGVGQDAARRHVWGMMKGIEWGATHICIFGGDQSCELDMLEKFCTHMEDGWDAVTALVPARGKPTGLKPFASMAWKWKDPSMPKPVELGYLNQMEMIDPEDGPYQEVCVTGSGAMMFDVKLLDSLKKPWLFLKPSDENAKHHSAMDTTFVWRLLTEAGGRMVCDTTIKTEHLDVFVIDETYPDRFSDWGETSRSESLYRHLDL